MAADEVLEIHDGESTSDVDDAVESVESPDDSTEPACPVWAVAVGSDPLQDGTREHPYHGLQEALDQRSTCDHVVLAELPGTPVFDIAVDIVVGAAETLLIEGEAEAATVPVFDGWGLVTGLRARGEGLLVLRRLVVKNGAGPHGGCLEATVGGLELDDTRWEGCSATGDGGAVAVTAGSLRVSGSVFLRNVAGGLGGAIAADGTSRDTIAVEECEFLANRAFDGGGVAILAPTTESLVSGSTFVGNEASRGGSAITGRLGGRIVGNRFEANEGPDGGAVAGDAGWHLALFARNVVVSNVTWHSGSPHEGTPGAALRLSPAYGVVCNNLFLRNEIRSAAGPDALGTGAVLLDGGSPSVVNNVFAENAGGEVAHLMAANADVRNNVFVGGAGFVGYRLTVHSGGSAAVDYNLEWMMPEGRVDADVEVGRHGVVADPRFVDVPNDDYLPAGGSPCLDAGDPGEEFRDWNGSRNDMGAFGGPDGNWVPLGLEDG